MERKVIGKDLMFEMRHHPAVHSVFIQHITSLTASISFANMDIIIMLILQQQISVRVGD